jgi:oligopeptidase B
MKTSYLLIASALLMIGCASSDDNSEKDSKMSDAPMAKKVPMDLTDHGHTRIDNYYWMRLSDEQKEAPDSARDGQTQDVLDYLNAENAYTKKEMAHTEAFQESLYNEIVGRIKQTDMSIPTKMDGYWYYSRYEEGQDYAVNCRKKGSMDAAEEILLNQPEMAEGHSYFSVGGQSVSTNNNLLVYGVDLVSRRQYTLYIKDLATGELLADKIENTTGGATWANDNRTFFYTRKDPVTLRSSQIYKHVLGTDPASDQMVYEEADETFSCAVFKTKSKDYLMIASFQTLSSEYRFLDANNPEGQWTVIQPRERDLEYSVSQYQENFYIITNADGAKNFKLMKTAVKTPGKANWKEVIPHRTDVLLEGIELFSKHMVVEERSNGLNQIRVMKWDGSGEYYMEFPDPAYSAGVAFNPEFNTSVMRYSYTSLTTPNSTFDFNLDTKESVLLKQQEVMDPNFSVDNYTSERIMVKARDGAEVPVSIVYRKGTKLDGSAPLLLYAYGSYGSSMDAYFSSVRLSMLDRGFVYAIAHIRGGQEMGRHWYEDGKLLKKKNTFTDFIDCGQFLLDNNYSSKDKMFAMGGSAGGLLMGAILNMAPDMWQGVVAEVPFVDVVTTMLDESIPLTTGEWDEWGDPHEKEYYDYMLSYSPYDQVEAKNYPNMFVGTGYWDSQVQYWEPAKWVAKLRDLKTDNNQLLLYCDMEAGHGGASGRFKRHRETAMIYAWMMDQVGITE